MTRITKFVYENVIRWNCHWPFVVVDRALVGGGGVVVRVHVKCSGQYVDLLVVAFALGVSFVFLYLKFV